MTILANTDDVGMAVLAAIGLFSQLQFEVPSKASRIESNKRLPSSGFSTIETPAAAARLTVFVRLTGNESSWDRYPTISDKTSRLRPIEAEGAAMAGSGGLG